MYPQTKIRSFFWETIAVPKLALCGCLLRHHQLKLAIGTKLSSVSICAFGLLICVGVFPSVKLTVWDKNCGIISRQKTGIGTAAPVVRRTLHCTLQGARFGWTTVRRFSRLLLVFTKNHSLFLTLSYHSYRNVREFEPVKFLPLIVHVFHER